MEARSIQKFLHTTPRKLRLVADMARKMEPGKAVEILSFTKKAAAKDLIAAIQVAMANAKEKGMVASYFKAIEVNEGPKMRRFRAGTRGRAKPYKKRMAHIRIVLSDDLSAKAMPAGRQGKVQSAKLKIARPVILGSEATPESKDAGQASMTKVKKEKE